MNIEFTNAKELFEMISLTTSKPAGMKPHPWEIGKNYFLRTVTHHFTGHLVEVYDAEIVLTQAAWIADDGRFTAAVGKGEFSEVEVFPKDKKVIISRASLIDAVTIDFPLPGSQK